MKTLLTILLLLISTVIYAQYSSPCEFINSFSRGIDYDADSIEIKRTYGQEQEYYGVDTNYTFIQKPRYVILIKEMRKEGEPVGTIELYISKDKFKRMVEWIENDPKSNPARAAKYKYKQ